MKLRCLKCQTINNSSSTNVSCSECGHDFSLGGFININAEDAFKKVTAKKEKVVRAKRNPVVANSIKEKNNNAKVILLVGIFILLGLTNPSDEQHYTEMTKLLMTAINDNVDLAGDEWEMLGQGLGLALAGKMIDTFLSSYVEVNNYVFFSITKVEDNIIGYGLLNNVWIFDKVQDAFASKN